MRRPTHLQRFLVAGLLAPGACGGPVQTGPVSMDDLPLLQATEVARIGHFDDPDLGFSRLGSVDVDRDGNIYALEISAPEIRVFAPDGTRLRALGRQGEGPGEFTSAPFFGVRGDTVWTIETFNGRLTLFHRDGEVLQTGTAERVVVPLPEALGVIVPQSLTDDGTFIGHFGLIMSNRGNEPTGVEPTDSIPWPLVSFAPSGEVVDTLGWVPKPPPRMWRPPWEADVDYRMVDIAGRRLMVPRPPTTLPMWYSVGTDRLIVETPAPATGASGAMTVTRVALEGDTLFHQVLAYTPVPYVDADLDSIAARAARGGPGGMAPFNPDASTPDDWEVVANRLRAEMDFPEFQLPLESSWPTPDGGVWLRRAGDRSTGTAEWVVLDADGRARGRLRLPASVRPRWTRGDTLWASVPDELEVPWLVRYRIEGS